jgi:lipoic acid synthetase
MVRMLGLQYAVVTSVTRDDLVDGGAAHFAAVIRSLHGNVPGIIVEILVPDFRGRLLSIQTVMDAGPKVFGHNVETVPRLYKELRPGADYHRSLEVLAQAKKLYPQTFTKSSLMLGLGETRAEVRQCMEELAECGCDILVLGQYLRPSKAQVPVERFLDPEEFLEYEAAGWDAGFKAVSCGPLVRSSYKARDIYNRLLAQKGSICTTRS